EEGIFTIEVLEISVMTYPEAIRLVYYWQYESGTSFTCKIFELWMKADPNNKTRLAHAFPAEIQAVSDWYAAPDPEEFFKQHGIHKQE
ncbi:MAG: hypothetical protein L0287_31735, partial [Anaerolineae bacterium]|nr:hypothetical protein [Anaerolineae bacterium]